MNLLIHNVTVFTNDEQNNVLSGQAVAIEGSTIRALGPVAELRQTYSHFQELDGQGRLLMPGLVNAHMHFYGTYARGLGLPRVPQDFGQILAWLWWTLDKALDLDGVYYSTLLPAILGVKHGITAFIDHHASPKAVEGSLDKIEEALALLGMRGLLCYEVSDRDGKAIRDAGLQENARYIRKCRDARQANPDHLFDGIMGLHASFTLDDDTLEQAARIAAELDRGHHIHVLEGTLDEQETRRKYGVGVAQRLYDVGIFGPKTIAAHGIYLDEKGMDQVAERDTIVVHNPQSNMNNAVGCADIFALLDRGVTVGIGTDGMTPDVKVDVRTGFLMHKHHLQDPNAGWDAFKDMLLKHNPAIYRRLTGQKVGRVQSGYLADLILVDYAPPTVLNGDTFWGHFLFGIADAPVNSTIINGRIVMHDKKIAGIDEQAIARASQAVASETWQRFRDLSE
jgi:putative selenium metabolism protein SsnA